MIRDIIEAVKLCDYIGLDRDMDVAQGRFEYPKEWKDFMNRTKRIKAWQTK